MSGLNGGSWFWLRRLLSQAWRWVRASICLICLAWVLTAPVWSDNFVPSDPDWRELTKHLDEIEAGLLLIVPSLSTIESNLAEREQLLSRREAALSQREQQLNATDRRLQQREQALNGFEQDLKRRASLYGDMEVSLERAEREVRLQKWRGRLLAAGIAVVAGYGGYRIGRAAK